MTGNRVGVCVPQGGSPGTPEVDVGNGMDRIPASFLSGMLSSCEDSATPTTAVLDAGYPEDHDPELSTTDLDGLYVDGDGLAGVDLEVRWLSSDAVEAESAWIGMVESSEGRWDLADLPSPGRYVFEMHFSWDDGSLDYAAKVSIPDPFG